MKRNSSRLRRLAIFLSAALGYMFCSCGDVTKGPFDGTWKVDLDQSSFPTEPYVFSVSNGMYDCDSCVPKIHIKADGNDQAATSESRYTTAVMEVDSHTIRIISKTNGKTVSEQIDTALGDGRKLEVERNDFPLAGGKPKETKYEYERIGEALANANSTSGSWRMREVKASENGLLVTFKNIGRELAASSPLGISWKARYDGKDFPVNGSYSTDSVSLRQINVREVVATYKQGGHVVRIDDMTVSADGNTLTTRSRNVLSGRSTLYVDTRQ